MFIFQIDAANITGPENKKGISQMVDNPESVLLGALSQTSRSNQVEGVQGINQPFLTPLLEKIIGLTNEYIMYAKEHQNFYRGNDDPAHQIIKAPPWENSNELFDTLAQYTGMPSSDEKIGQIKSFFYGIMRSRPTDPNNDGAQDYKDVLSLWGSDGGPEPVTKGDVNGDGTINQDDLIALKDALNIKTGDINGDGKLDEVDQKWIEDIVSGRPVPLIHRLGGDMNHDGKIDQEDLKIFKQVLNAGDMDNDGKVDQVDLRILTELIGTKDPLTKIKDLSKALLEDPYHNLIEVPKLGKALAKYTNTEYDLGKADSLISFFLRDKSDLTGDGQIDYQDVIAFWKSLDHQTPKPPFRAE